MGNLTAESQADVKNKYFLLKKASEYLEDKKIRCNFAAANNSMKLKNKFNI